MKILIFYQYFTTPQGSWGTRIYEFAKEWVKKGHEVTVVTSIYSKSDIKANKFIDTQFFDGIEVKIINIKIDNKQPKLKRIYTFLAYSLISCWYALTLKTDIAIASSGPITVGLPGLAAKFFTKKKLVYEVRDLWPETPIELGVIKNSFIKYCARKLEKILYKNALLVVGLSEGMKDYISSKFNHNNVIAITNAANLKLFSTKKKFPKTNKLSKDDFYVIYTGNIGEVNNSFWLVNASRILKKTNHNNIKIVLIGDGQQKEQILSIIEKEDLNNLIHFDLMKKEDLVTFIQYAKASLVPLKPNPILDTSSPNKFFESLAAGVPIIQTTNGWIKDYIDEYKIGYTVDGSKPKLLAELLIELYNEQEKLKIMKSKAKERAVLDFDQIFLANKYLQSLEDL
ncbi:glycosyltransferase family 4 protein [Flavobacteriaceae bacterium MHTCC 0001]